MTDYYVSQFWGDDTNDGLSLATAVKTVGAVPNLSSNDVDTIYVYPGIYKEGYTIGIKTMIAVGKVIMDGEYFRPYAFRGTTETWHIGVENFEIRNYISAGIQDSPGGANDKRQHNNTIYNCRYGITNYSTTNNGRRYITFNTIYNCWGGAISDTILSVTGSEYKKNTIYDCPIGIEFTRAATANNVTIEDNIFSQCGTALKMEASGTLNYANNNLYDVPSGSNFGDINDSLYTTMSGWQAAINGEASGKSGDPLFANATAVIFSVLNGSPAQSGAASGDYIGAHLSEVGWYNDELMQSGVSTTNIEFVDTMAGSGAMVSGTETSGILELGVIDMGASGNIDAILGQFLEILPTHIIDADISDNIGPSGGSGLVIEFRTGSSATGILSEQYVEYNRKSAISSGTFEDRFIQAKITLNRTEV